LKGTLLPKKRNTKKIRSTKRIKKKKKTEKDAPTLPPTETPEKRRKRIKKIKSIRTNPNPKASLGAETKNKNTDRNGLSGKTHPDRPLPSPKQKKLINSKEPKRLR
jgi:hypothetical protein